MSRGKKFAVIVCAFMTITVGISVVHRPIASRADPSLEDQAVREVLSGIPEEPTLAQIDETLPLRNPEMRGVLTGGKELYPFKVNQKAMERLKSPRGIVDLECQLLRLSLMSLNEVAEWPFMMVIPMDEEGLFTNPFLLWKPKDLRFRGIRHITFATQEDVDRFVLETVGDINRGLSAGDVIIVADPDYGAVPFRSAWVLCQGDTEPVLTGAFLWIPPHMQDPENRHSLEDRRSWYWTNVYYLQLFNAVGITAKRNGGNLPKTRAEIVEAVGPENARAWPRPVAMFVDNVLPRIPIKLVN